MKIKTTVSQIMVIGLGVLTFGCASITGSKNQPVSVQAHHNGKPIEGADCVLTNDKGTWFIKTPGSTVVQKSGQDLTVTCSKNGIPAGSASVVSSANGGVWGNILFGGLIGYAVDASTGAAFDYPTSMGVQMGQVIRLEPPKSQQSDQTQNTVTPVATVQSQPVSNQTVVSDRGSTIERSYKKTVSVGVNAATGLPVGWVLQPVSDTMKSNGVVLSAINTNIDAGMVVNEGSKTEFTDVSDFSKKRIKDISSNTSNTDVSKAELIVVGGLPVYRTLVTGSVSGNSFTYVLSVFEVDGKYKSVVVWSLSSKFGNVKDEMVAAADSQLGNVGISQNRSATSVNRVSKINPVASNIDSTSVSDVQRLRELKSLLDEGVITQQEYDKKKAVILKKM